jgi:hypothetical protein
MTNYDVIKKFFPEFGLGDFPEFGFYRFQPVLIT